MRRYESEMLNILFSSFFWGILWAWKCFLIEGLTKADENRELSRGSTNVILGALQGQVYLIRRGVSEGGEIDTIMEERIGDFFKLGKPWVHYPKWPALHLAIASGKREQMNAAFYLMSHGANVTHYELPVLEIDKSHSLIDIGYGPAMLYALGMGGLKVNHQHAALLQRLLHTLPSHFNMSVVATYLNNTGNPPLMQIPVYATFTEGVHVLLEDFGLNVNDADTSGVTALHVAAWLGRIDLVVQLLSKGADRLLADIYGRTPLHYAVMRGHTAIAGLFFVSTAGGGNPLHLRNALLQKTDKHGRNALALAGLVPPLSEMLALLRKEMKESEVTVMGPGGRRPLQLAPRLAFELEAGDFFGNRGGWLFPTRLQSSSVMPIVSDAERGLTHNDIDTIRGSALSKGVFKRDYFFTQRPVLLTHDLFANQPIWAFWRREEFLERYGKLKVAVVSDSDTLKSPNAQRSATTLNEFLADQRRHTHEKSCAENSSCPNPPKYSSAFTNSASTQEPLLWTDVVPPALFQLCAAPSAGVSSEWSTASRQRKFPLRLVASPPGSSFPMHTRAASWELLVTGHKRWFLMPPTGQQSADSGLLSNLDLDVEQSDPYADARKRATALDKLRGNIVLFEAEVVRLRSEGLLFEVSQLPGDVLFVPHDWYQMSMSHDSAESISISQEFCSWTHSDTRFLPLPFAIYGGEDPHRDQPGHALNAYEDFFGKMSVISVAARSDLPQFANFEF